jgi:hypothetical protein
LVISSTDCLEFPLRKMSASRLYFTATKQFIPTAGMHAKEGTPGKTSEMGNGNWEMGRRKAQNGPHGPKRQTACCSPCLTTLTAARERHAGFDWATSVEMPMSFAFLASFLWPGGFRFVSVACAFFCHMKKRMHQQQIQKLFVASSNSFASFVRNVFFFLKKIPLYIHDTCTLHVIDLSIGLFSTLCVPRLAWPGQKQQRASSVVSFHGPTPVSLPPPNREERGVPMQGGQKMQKMNFVCNYDSSKRLPLKS